MVAKGDTGSMAKLTNAMDRPPLPYNTYSLARHTLIKPRNLLVLHLLLATRSELRILIFK